MKSHNISSLLLLLSIFSVVFAACKDPAAECGCPPRKTFDLQYLESNKPNLIAENPSQTFYAPTVTYPDCKAIISECPQPGSTMIALIAADGESKFHTEINGEPLTNPFDITNVRCSSIKEWWLNGLGSIQASLDSYKLGCMVPK